MHEGTAARQDPSLARNTSIVVRQLRGPLEVAHEPLPEPGPRQVRIRVEAAGVSQADITIRNGMYPTSAPLPFTLGYDAVGRIDKLGSEVKHLREGQRVAAIVVRGAYTQYLCWDAEDVTPVPEGVEPSKAVCLLLNYLTAYQMLHRVAQVKGGEKVLVTSAAGGVGTALLQLGRLQGLEMYGTASTGKLELVRSLGATPIDYTREDFARRMRELVPGGVDVALDAIGGTNFNRAYSTLKRGGHFVAYGFTSAMNSPFWGRVDTFARYGWLMMKPDGRKATFYGIMFWKRDHPDWFREDLTALLELHRQGKLEPVVAGTLPLTEASRALEMLDTGKVQGKLVLDCTR
ncbi:medium chain dehydrogenase/reductase family protein [Hyalangium versicolor]|uniref:medium chain dehydrogenase/reductase family protein n=1 Tax=Hyalangium versicolor TaxID=2861190 RepID=UPI001CCE651C|nr:medium chain dehydrogenase/reductase family protein [Hyalangium versicolor]